MISFVLAGVIDGAFPQSADGFYLIHVLLIAVLLFSWCGKHAEENDIVPPNGAQVLCGLIGLIGVPLYLFRAFGFKNGGIKFLIGIAFILVSGLLYMLTFSIAEAAILNFKG